MKKLFEFCRRCLYVCILTPTPPLLHFCANILRVSCAAITHVVKILTLSMKIKQNHLIACFENQAKNMVGPNTQPNLHCKDCRRLLKKVCHVLGRCEDTKAKSFNIVTLGPQSRQSNKLPSCLLSLRASSLESSHQAPRT